MSALPAERHVQLSWVLPLFRTRTQLPELCERIREVSARLALRHEVILVDDACPEGSGVLATELAETYPQLQVLRLPRNGGQDDALREGLRVSRGEWAVVLDADLQDPPEAVTQLWPLRSGDVDVVFALRTGRYTTPGRHFTSRLYRNASAALGGLPRGAGLYALLSRPLVDRINASHRRRTMLLSLIAAARPRCATTSIVRSPRASGVSSYGGAARAGKAMRSLWQMLLARRLHRPLR